jgi:hypothetical protein
MRPESAEITTAKAILDADDIFGSPQSHYINQKLRLPLYNRTIPKIRG